MSLYDHTQFIKSLEKILEQLNTGISDIRKFLQKANHLERMLRIQQELKSIKTYILLSKEEIN